MRERKESVEEQGEHEGAEREQAGAEPEQMYKTVASAGAKRRRMSQLKITSCVKIGVCICIYICVVAHSLKYFFLFFSSLLLPRD